MTLVLFDTNVLAAAVCQPDGVCFRLVRAANAGIGIEGLVTDVTGFEFMRICMSGELGEVFSADEIDEFVEVFPNLFSVDRIIRNAPTRRLSERPDLHNATVEEVMVEVYGVDISRARKKLPRKGGRGLDPYDVHLAWAALTAECDLVCTSDNNVHQNLTVCEVIRPFDLWEAINV